MLCRRVFLEISPSGLFLIHSWVLPVRRQLNLGVTEGIVMDSQRAVISDARATMASTAASVVRQTDATLFKVALARFTFSRISVALAVQIKGLGFWLCSLM